MFRVSSGYAEKIVPAGSLGVLYVFVWCNGNRVPGWKLERALYCEPCSEGKAYSRRQRGFILGLEHRLWHSRDTTALDRVGGEPGACI